MGVNKLDVNLVIEMKNNGLTNGEIAEYFGVTAPAVVQLLSKHKGEYLYRGKGRNPKIVLSPEQEKYIRDLKKAGYSLTDISAKTGLSRTYISRYLKEEK